MTGYKEYFDPEIIIFEVIFWNLGDVDSSLVLSDSIYLDTVFDIVCDCNDLWMIAFDIYLLDLTLAEHTNLHPQKVFIKNCILFQISRSHKPHEHYDVIGSLVIA